MNDLPFAEDMNYFQTSTTSSDIWIEKSKKLISDIGGVVIAEGYGNESTTNRSAFILRFNIEGDTYKLIWPILPCRNAKNQRAAKIQAATFIYHDVKAKCMSSEILGKRAIFFAYMELPDGRTASQASISELSRGIPSMFLLSKGEE